ncbi:MAG: glycosyltransferase family 39 protein, partial [Thermoguttaceae bacterium]
MNIQTATSEKSRISLILWGSITLFCLIEVFLPPFCIWNFREDLLEQIMIGREWVLTSNKHPALTTWIAQIFWVGTNHSDYALYLASAVCVFLSFFAIWRLGREFLSPEKNLFATLAMMAFWYFNIGATRFNNNITLMPCWLWAIYFFYFALKSGKISWWVLTGLMLGIGLNCKYTCILLCFAMVIYLVLERDVRRFWKTPGPWLTVGTAALVFLPHVLAV